MLLTSLPKELQNIVNEYIDNDIHQEYFPKWRANIDEVHNSSDIASWRYYNFFNEYGYTSCIRFGLEYTIDTDNCVIKRDDLNEWHLFRKLPDCTNLVCLECGMVYEARKQYYKNDEYILIRNIVLTFLVGCGLAGVIAWAWG